MRVSRRRRIILAAAAVAVAAVGLGAGQAMASTRHSGLRGHGFHRSAGWAQQPAPAQPSSSRQPGGSAGASAPGSRPTGTAAPTRTAAPTAAPTTTAPTQAPASPGDASAPVTAVLAQINKMRADNGLPALQLSTGLMASAETHNKLMINGGGFSHQCPGEASLGDRISAQGVKWNSLGENIGKGGPIADNVTAITQAAEGQTNGMYNETAPNDGHRKNILGKGFAHIGISIIRDSHGDVWMTQDFSN